MLRAYFRWFNFRHRSPYRNIPLIGNPNEIVGHAEEPSSNAPTFQRASFGKYERRRKKKKWGLVLAIVLISLALTWVAWISIQAIGIFSG